MSDFQLKVNPETGATVFWEQGMNDWEEVQAKRNPQTGEVAILKNGGAEWRNLGVLGGEKPSTPDNFADKAADLQFQSPPLPASRQGIPPSTRAPGAMPGTAPQPSMPSADAAPMVDPAAPLARPMSPRPVPRPVSPPDNNPLVAAMMGLDTTDNARAARGFGRAGYLDGLVDAPNAPANPVVVPQAAPSEPSQPLSDLGSRFARGVTEIGASLPEAAALAGAGNPNAAALMAQETVQQAQAQIAEAQDRLQTNPEQADQINAVIAEQQRIIAAYQPLVDAAQGSIKPDIKDRPLYQRGEAIRQASQDLFGTPDPQFDDRFLGKLVEGGGSLTGFVGTAILTGPLGAAAAGSSVNAAGMYRRAIQDGATEEQARSAAYIASIVGASEVLPIGRALGQLPSGIRERVTGALSKRLTNAFTTAGEEGLQEAMVEIANNLTEKGIWNREQDVFEGAGESALIGAILGGGLGAIAPTGREPAASPGPAPQAQTTAPTAPPAPQAPDDLVAAMTPEQPAPEMQGPPQMQGPPRPAPFTLEEAMRVPPEPTPVAQPPVPESDRSEPGAAAQPQPQEAQSVGTSETPAAGFNPAEWEEIPGVDEKGETGRTWYVNSQTGEVVDKPEFDRRRTVEQGQRIQAGEVPGVSMPNAGNAERVKEPDLIAGPENAGEKISENRALITTPQDGAENQEVAPRDGPAPGEVGSTRLAPQQERPFDEVGAQWDSMTPEARADALQQASPNADPDRIKRLAEKPWADISDRIKTPIARRLPPETPNADAEDDSALRDSLEGNETAARARGREDFANDAPRRLPPYIDPTDDVAARAWYTGWDEANLSDDPITGEPRPLPDLAPQDRRLQWNDMSASQREQLLRTMGGFDKRDGNLTKGGQNAIKKDWDKLSAGARGKIETAWRGLDEDGMVDPKRPGLRLDPSIVPETVQWWKEMSISDRQTVLNHLGMDPNNVGRVSQAFEYFSANQAKKLQNYRYAAPRAGDKTFDGLGQFEIGEAVTVEDRDIGPSKIRALYQRTTPAGTLDKALIIEDGTFNPLDVAVSMLRTSDQAEGGDPDGQVQGQGQEEVNTEPGRDAPATPGTAAQKRPFPDFSDREINGYDDDTSEDGRNSPSKTEFHKAAKSFLNAAAKILKNAGWTQMQDRRGKPIKAVRSNWGGMAGSGEVTLVVQGPDSQRGVFVQIGDNFRKPKGVNMMWRVNQASNPYGSGDNRFSDPTGMTPMRLAEMLMNAHSAIEPKKDAPTADTDPAFQAAKDSGRLEVVPVTAETEKPQRDEAATPTPETEVGQGEADAATVRLAARLRQLMGTPDYPKNNAALMKMAAEDFGGTIAEGAFSPKDAYEAQELALNLTVRDLSDREGIYDPTTDSMKVAKADVEGLQNLIDTLPTQTRRDSETDAFQQFSTPPQYGYAVNWIANIKEGDQVLEPSAGNGGIAMFAKNAGAKVDVNEIAERRVPSLKALGFDRVTTENAEQIGNIWAGDKSRRYDVVVMNPPFSAAGTRGTKNTSATGAQHLQQALNMMHPGGRLVAIMGHTFQPSNSRVSKFFEKLDRDGYTVQANVVVVGDQVYKKYGTTYDNRLLVIDKAPAPDGHKTLTGKAETIPDLLDMMEGIRDVASDRSTVDRSDGDVEQDTRREDGGRSDQTGGDRGTVEPKRNPVSDDLGGDRDAKSRSGRSPRSDGDAVRPARDTQEDAGVRESAESDARSGADGSRSGPGKRSGGPTLRLKDAEESTVQDAGGGFAKYRPSRVRIEGAKEHPMLLVESSAMATVNPPRPDYDLKLPAKMVKDGLLSEAQLEQVVYAGAAHAEMLPNNPGEPAKRKGYYIGDGTGVGKTREIAGIIADNWAQGRKKHVLISKDKKLLKGARRDFDNVGMKSVQITDLAKTKGTGSVPKDYQGVLFTTYSTLGTTPKKDAKSRIEQIVEWVGPEFDGTIIFDEAHLAGNALPIKGKRGTSKPSKQALSVIDLQNQLPNARVVYASATAATEVYNLAYADRLGLWGAGTPFPNVLSFVNQIVKGGIAAMEVVARDMKQMGVYMARGLSYEGVEYEKVEHALTQDQRRMYDASAQAWQNVLSNVNEAIATMTDGGGQQRAAAMAQFWSAHQRFFNQVLTSMQMPSVIDSIKKDLKAGRSPVVQIVNTNEAATNRAIAKLDEDQTLDDIDITPRDMIIQFLETSFPTTQYETYVDDDGNQRSRPVKDSKGNTVDNAEAVALRDRLIDEMASMMLPGNPLDLLIETFGPTKVAEVTGRTTRIITKNGKKVSERRSQAKAMAEAADFQGGKRDVLIFSDAGGTGMDFHADKGAKNNKRRSHYIVQAGWRADRAIQGFGRTHRTNQTEPPIYKLAGTNLSGHKRFTSSIARRLDQLGALTKGQKDAGGGMFDATDNLENEFAEAAVISLFSEINAGKLEGFDMADVSSELGLNLKTPEGQFSISKIPPVPQFLNRLLNVTIDKQNMLFDRFVEHMQTSVQDAIERGEFTAGVEEVKHDGAVLNHTKEAYRDEGTGATSEYRMITLTKKVHAVKFADLPVFSQVQYKRDRDTDAVYMFRPASSRTNERGEVVPTYHRYSPTDRTIIDAWDYRSKYDLIKEDEAQTAWDQQYEEAPKFREETLHMVTGALLPIWDRLPNENMTIKRLTLDDGRSVLGRVIPDVELTETLQRLGVDGPQIDMDGAQMQQAVMGGKTVLLSSGHKLVRRKVGGENRVEVISPPSTAYQDTTPTGTFKRVGFQHERIGYKNRFFIPLSDAGAASLDAFMQGKNITNVTMEKDQRSLLDDFYSPVRRAVESAKQKQAPAQDWKAIIAKLPGVKKAELDWLGVNDWLDQQEGQVTREDLAEYIAFHQIELEEVSLGGSGRPEIRYEAGDWAEPDNEYIAEMSEDFMDDAREEVEQEWADYYGVESLDDMEPEDIDNRRINNEVKERAEDMARKNFTPSERSFSVWDEDGNWQANGFQDEDGDVRIDGELFSDMRSLEEWAEEQTLSQSGFDGQPNFESYTEDGGSNYREILLTVPNLHESGPNAPARRGVKVSDEPFEQQPFDWEQKRPFFETGHFQEPNIVVHARVKDRRGANGERIMFVEEIQSDLATKWRENSESPEVAARRRYLKGLRHKIETVRLNVYEDLLKKSPYAINLTARDVPLSSLKKVFAGDISIPETPTALHDKFFAEARDLILEREPDAARETEINDELLSLGSEKSMDPQTPETPFREDLTYQLMVKRLMQKAAREGYDRLSWTPGYMQAQRWNKAAQSVVEGVDWYSPDQNSVADYRYVDLKMSGGDVHMITVETDGTIEAGPKGARWEGKQLSQVLGPNVTKSVLSETSGSVSGQKITFPDSGYAIAYDQQTKKAVDKMARKFGSKVYVDRTLPDFELIDNFDYQSAMRDMTANQVRDRLVSAGYPKSNADTIMRQIGPTDGSKKFSMLRDARAISHKIPLRAFDQDTDRNDPVWSVDITPELRKAAAEPQPIMRRDPTGIAPSLAESRTHKALRRDLDKLGLKDVTLQYDPALEGQGQVTADYWGKVGIVLGQTANPRATLGHEALHVFRHWNLFTDQEWRVLSREAERTWLEQYDIATRYPDLTKDEQIEEAVAEAFGEVFYSKAKPPQDSAVKAAMRKISQMLKAIGNWARGMGLQTPQQVMEAFASGEVPKQRKAAKSGAMQKDARAPRRNQTTQQRTSGGLYLPDRYVWDSLMHTNGGIFARLSAAKAALGDRVDLIRTRIQDRMLPVRRAQEKVEKVLGGKLDEDIDVYLAEEMYAGRTGAKLDMIDREFTQKIIDIIARTKDMSVESVGEFLYARHARERNDQIAQINPKFPDGGSGMPTAVARQILAQIQSGPNAGAYDEIAQIVDDMREWGVQQRVDMGLMTQTAADAWRAAYDHYVPLKGWEETDFADAALDISGVGRGYNVRGQESRMAMGRASEAFNPLVAAITQAQEVAVRAEKNRVGQHLYRLAKDIPSRNLWTVKRAETRRVFNETTGLVEDRTISPITLIQAANEMAVKVDGKEYRIVMHDPRIARAITSVGVEGLHPLIKPFAIMNRYLSAVNTMLDPEFVIRNFARDAVTANINIQSQAKGSAIQKGMMKDLPKALLGTWRGLGGKADTEWSKYFREFSEAGGKVHFWVMENPEANRDQLRRRLKREANGWKGRALGLVTPSTDLNPILNGLERINLAVDNALRLSAFVNARRVGMSKQQAASIAKNLTVNFNRRGDWGSAINSAYLFANAAMQGSHIMLKAMKHRKVQAIVAGMVAAGYLLDTANAYLSEEDEDGELAYDKIPDWKNQMNLTIMWGQDSGQAATIWLPYGYNVFPYLGQQIGKVTRGVKEPKDALGDLAAAVFGAFSPINGKDLQSTLTPTALDIVNDFTQNEDWLGRPIRPESPWGDYGPQAYKYYSGASSASREIAAALNQLSGGTVAEAGAVDVSPEYIDHAFGILTGGAGRFVGRVADTGAKLARGEAGEIEARNIPFYRSLQTETGDWLDRERYYVFRQQVTEARQAAKDYRESGQQVPAHILRLAGLHDLNRQTEAKLRKLRQARNAINSNASLSASQKSARRQNIDDQSQNVYLVFNRAFVKSIGPQGE